MGSILENCGKIWKNGRFSGRLWPDWGNTVLAAMAGLGSKGLTRPIVSPNTIKGRLRGKKHVLAHIYMKFHVLTILYIYHIASDLNEGGMWGVKHTI